MARAFNPAAHPRDRFGRFTKSRTVKASAKDRKAARGVADGFQPRQVSTAERGAYLAGITDRPANVRELTDANRALRAGKQSDAADELDAAMVELPDDLLLSRQVPASAFGSTDPTSLQGMKVRDAGFAPAQLGTVQAADGQVRMHLAVPAGTRAAVDPDSGEVVLDKDTEMVVAKVATNSAGGHDMWLTVLPKQGAKQADPAKPKPADVAKPAADNKPPAVLGDRIPAVVDQMAASPGGVVSLVRLRDELADVDRADLDAELLRLDRERVIQLDPDPNRLALTDKARAAAIPLGGEDMHLVSVVKPINVDDDYDDELPSGGGELTRADLMKLTVPELRERMRGRGLKPGRMRKSQMVDALIADETGDETAPVSFDDRVAASVTGQDALAAAPLSLFRQETHSRLGNRNGLGVASRDALADYQEAGFHSVNGVLRGGTSNRPDVDTLIDGIDTAVNASPLKADVQTWRGVRRADVLFGDRFDSNLTGLEWREDAYVSTSARRDVAGWFTSPKTGARMRVLIPAGTGAVEVSDMLDEAELLLGHGHTLRVVTDRGFDADGIRDLDVEVLP